MKVSKINVGSSEVAVAVGKLLLKIDPVFLYKIPQNFIHDNFHRASAWNISAPDWRGKLVVIMTGAGEDCCQVQFRNSDGLLFGVAVITKSDFSSSRAFQKVRDSSRYCTQQIQNIVSRSSASYGVGFLRSEHISQLIHCLQEYFGLGAQNETSVGRDASIRCTQHAQVKTEVTDRHTEDTKYTHHNHAQIDTQDEIVITSRDPKYTGHAPAKVEVQCQVTQAPTNVQVAGETSHASTSVKVRDETVNFPINLKVEDQTAHAPIIEDGKAHAQIIVKYKQKTVHAPNNLKAEDETLLVPINMEVEKETAHAPTN